MFLESNNKIKWKSLTIAIFTILLVIITGVLWFDKPVYLFIRQFDCNAWDIFGRIFSGYVWIAAGAIFLCAFYIKKCIQSKPKFHNESGRISLLTFINDALQKIRTSYVFYIFCACLMSGIVAKILKTLIGRFRPAFFEELDMVGFNPFSTEWAFNSMPSGHTTVSFAGLFMIGSLVPQKYKWLIYLLASTIAFSRVAAGFHWPTDVILGAFIGIACANIIRATFAKINS